MMIRITKLIGFISHRHFIRFRLLNITIKNHLILSYFLIYNSDVRFGILNTINMYLSLNFVLCEGDFKERINRIRHTKSESH